MSNFIKQSSRKTVLNKKKLGKILEPNHNGKNFSLIATGRELGLDLDDIFDVFGVFIANTFTEENKWESFSQNDSTLFKNKETDTEAMLLPIGHSHNDEPDIWDVRINLGMKDLFTNYIKNQ
mgnify:FL=1